MQGAVQIAGFRYLPDRLSTKSIRVHLDDGTRVDISDLSLRKAIKIDDYLVLENGEYKVIPEEEMEQGA